MFLYSGNNLFHFNLNSQVAELLGFANGKIKVKMRRHD